MKDRKGNEIAVGDRVKFHFGNYLGTVVGFEQEGTRFENVRVRNRAVGWQGPDGWRIAGQWPRSVVVVAKAPNPGQ